MVHIATPRGTAIHPVFAPGRMIGHGKAGTLVLTFDTWRARESPRTASKPDALEPGSRAAIAAAGLLDELSLRAASSSLRWNAAPPRREGAGRARPRVGLHGWGHEKSARSTSASRQLLNDDRVDGAPGIRPPASRAGGPARPVPADILRPRYRYEAAPKSKRTRPR